MAFQSDDKDYDYEFSCPNCGSSDVTIYQDEHGFISIGKCKKCGYKKEDKNNS